MTAPDLAAPRLLAGDERAGLVVLKSRFWSFNAIGAYAGDAACAIDPGIWPDEIDALRTALTERPPAAPRRVTHVVLTHSHHDHIRGWQRFPGARVVAPRAAAEKAEEPRKRILAAKNTIDRKLGIDDPAFTYPEVDEVFDERRTLDVGGLEVELRFLPGHSDCTSVVWIPVFRTLCSADYLVSPGLPYCRWRASAFEEAIETMRQWCHELGVERIVPAHNDVLEGREAIETALDAELDYFAFTREAAQRALASGASGENAARRVAAELTERRGRSLGGRERQDLDNARRVLDEEGARPASPIEG